LLIPDLLFGEAASSQANPDHSRQGMGQGGAPITSSEFLNFELSWDFPRRESSSLVYRKRAADALARKMGRAITLSARFLAFSLGGRGRGDRSHPENPFPGCE